MNQFSHNLHGIDSILLELKRDPQSSIIEILKELESIDLSCSPRFIPELKRQIFLMTQDTEENARLFETITSYSLTEFFNECIKPSRGNDSNYLINGIVNMLKEAIPELKNYLISLNQEEFTGYYYIP